MDETEDCMKHQGWRWTLGVLGLTALVAGCAGTTVGTSMSPSTSTTTVVQGWERYFRVDWTAQDQAGGREIDGYVYNTYGSPAMNVQVLAQALDATGNVSGQKLAWVPGVVPGLNRAYFRVAGLPAADRYRVSVWAFDWVQSDSPQR
jgi:hypothetical protein